MKMTRLFLVAVCSMLIGSSAFAQKKTLNEAQQKAQKSTIEYLRSKRYSPSIDTNDQSVCYKKGDILYWITFEGESAPLLYTIHRKSIRFADNKDKKLNHKREIAEKAANMICAEKVIKAYLDEGKVNFCLPIYAATPEDFQKVFDRGMNAFDNIKKTFDEKYEKSRLIVDTIHNYWHNLDTTIMVIPQANTTKETAQEISLSISGISVRVVNSNGTVLSDYDKGIRKNNCRYLQQKVTLTATKSGIYKIGVKLYTPDNKLLLPAKDSRFTTITTIDVQKANKPNEYELMMFGSDNDNMWKAGEYKIEFYDGETKIYTDAINIL